MDQYDGVKSKGCRKVARDVVKPKLQNAQGFMASSSILGFNNGRDLEDLSRDASHIFAESRGHNWSAMIMSLS
jgi:hypothetical protein